MSDSLAGLLAAALDARADLMARLHGEQTDAYRLFHGSVEGAPGLTVDRYGELLLVQSFHQSLTTEEIASLEAVYAAALPRLIPIYNDRSQPNSRIRNPLTADQKIAAHLPRQISELGVNYRFQARHEGQDPWLFLDMRAGRRWLMSAAADKSLLNLFAYTCGAGIAAAKAGARHVVNIDFAESGLRVAKESIALNDLPTRPRLLQSDVFPALRQYAGIGQPQMVRGKRLPPFPKLEPQQFDLVFLDPPRYAKGPFGVVDLVNDYPALFKPALLSTAPGGTLFCCNNVAEVEREAWLDQLQRSAVKAGRPIREFEWIAPEADFPSPDGKPPLKMLALGV
ncbi:MAG: class I SAM-dependent methyltransferase [Pseudomonadota bacterium]|nr:class I SAM-dependent methyltransferase [Pseudomonadota bacterium]MDP1572760.1 class I SAM-dependent methyltransferase [Pseudomonadota bacterium]MDP1904468.1 class I SAM-dependent methyltransferase [Pseudomonadota bacterium]